MVKRSRIWLLFLMTLMCTNMVLAKVNVRVNRQNIRENETFFLIIDKDGRSVATPNFDILEKNFIVGKLSTGMNITNINGRVRATTQWAVRLTPKKAGQIAIPAIQVGNEKTRPLTINVAKEQVIAGQPKDVFFESSVSTQSPYVQQHFLYTLRFYFRQPFIDAQSSLVLPRINGKEMQLLEEPKRFLAHKKGVDYQAYEMRYAYTPQKNGPLTISAPRFRGIMLVNQSGRMSYDAFARTFEKQVVAKGKEFKLDVKSIPASFTGKWWLPAKSVKISESWSKPIDKLKAGEAVTRKITITARGVAESQLPNLTFNDQQGLNVYPDKPETKSKIVDGEFLSTKQYSVAYVPTMGQQFTVEKLSVPWWDTTVNKARMASLPAHKLIAKGGQAAPVAHVSPITKVQEPKINTNQVNKLTANNNISHRFLWTVMVPLMLSGWLFGALALYRTRHKRPQVKQNKESQTPKLFKPSLKKLKTACNKGHVSDAHHLIVEVMQAYYPEQTVLNLTDVAQLFHDQELTELLSELNDQRYAGHDHQPWDGKALFNCFAKLLKQAKNKSNKDQNGLPELFISE